jgi:hypothetical protein
MGSATHTSRITKKGCEIRREPLKLRNYIRPEISMLLPAQGMKVVGWRGQVHDLT